MLALISRAANLLTILERGLPLQPAGEPVWRTQYWQHNDDLDEWRSQSTRVLLPCQVEERHRKSLGREFSENVG